MSRIRLIFALVAALGAVCMPCLVRPALAQDALAVDIHGPGQAKMNLVLSQPFAGGAQDAAARKLQDLIDKNLAFMPFLQTVPQSQVLGQISGPQADQIDFKPFGLARIDVLVTSGWTPGGNLGNVELRAFEVYSQKVLVGKGFDSVTDAQLPDIADRFCMELMLKLTGQGGFFNSQLAFSKPSGPKSAEIWTVRPMGRGLTKITSYGDLGMAISPSWSFDGGKIAFTLIGSRSHYLGIWSGGGKPAVHTMPCTSVVSPHFLPNGQVAVALNLKSESAIYILNSAFQPGAPTVKTNGIAVSPSFDKSGRLMAYVSDESGSPNIYLRDMSSGTSRRLTRFGYNTNPSLSPDGTLVAFTRQMGGGQKVFVIDVNSGAEQQVTSGGGSDENPSFAPDGYFIAFASTRGGASKIYITTRHGAQPVMVPTGDGSARMPSWGPLPGK
jgi:TolB protein